MVFWNMALKSAMDLLIGLIVIKRTNIYTLIPEWLTKIYLVYPNSTIFALRGHGYGQHAYMVAHTVWSTCKALDQSHSKSYGKFIFKGSDLFCSFLVCEGFHCGLILWLRQAVEFVNQLNSYRICLARLRMKSQTPWINDGTNRGISCWNGNVAGPTTATEIPAWRHWSDECLFVLLWLIAIP